MHVRSKNYLNKQLKDVVSYIPKSHQKTHTKSLYSPKEKGIYSKKRGIDLS